MNSRRGGRERVAVRIAFDRNAPGAAQRRQRVNRTRAEVLLDPRHEQAGQVRFLVARIANRADAAPDRLGKVEVGQVVRRLNIADDAGDRAAIILCADGATVRQYSDGVHRASFGL